MESCLVISENALDANKRAPLNDDDTTDVCIPLLVLAEMHHSKNLKIRAFYGLRTYAQMRGHKRIMCVTAELHFRKQTLTALLSIWSFHLMYNSDSAKRLLGAARAHHRRQVLLRCLHDWATRAYHWKYNRELMQKAYCHRSSVSDKALLLRSFCTWRSMTSDLRRAQQFRRQKALTSFFHHWLTLSRVSGERRWMHRLAASYYDNSVKRRWFVYWREELATLRRHRIALKQFWHRHKLAKCFVAWRKLHSRTVFVNQAAQQIRARSEQALLHVVWEHWRTYTHYGSSKESMVMAKQQRRNMKLVSTVFSNWYSLTLNHAYRVSIAQQFRLQIQTKRLHTIITRWHFTAMSLSVRRVRTEMSLLYFNERIRLIWLRGIIIQWKHLAEVQRKFRLAVEYHRTRLLRRSLRQWRKLHQCSTLKRQMVTSAKHFWSVTLKVRYWIIWRNAYVQAHRLRQLDTLALCRWSLCLQARTWSVWRSWIAARRSAHDQLRSALERRHRNIACKVMRIWLARAVELRWRKRIDLCQQLWNSDFHSFRLAANAFDHWYCYMTSKRTSVITRPAAIQIPSPELLVPAAPTLSDPLSKESAQPCSVHDDNTKLPILPATIFPEYHVNQSLPQLPEFLLPYLQQQGLAYQSSPSTTDAAETAVQTPSLHGFPSASSCEARTPDHTNSDLCFMLLVEKMNLLRELLEEYELKKQKMRLEQIFFSEKFDGTASSDQERHNFQVINIRNELQLQKHRCKVLLRNLIKELSDVTPHWQCMR